MSETIAQLHRRSSLLTWWPAVVDALVPAPATRIVRWGWERLADYLDGKGQEELVEAVYAEARQLGWPEKPVFLRTDQSSAKHSYRRTCYLPAGATKRDLGMHLYRLIDDSFTKDLLAEAIVVRQYLHLEAPYAAWEGLPVARERRYFVRDHQVLCHHPYWPEAAFESPIARPSSPNWREELARLNVEAEDEVRTLSFWASIVAGRLGGYWCVDFARDRDGQWWLIDMAAGEVSWHPECEAVREVRA